MSFTNQNKNTTTFTPGNKNTSAYSAVSKNSATWNLPDRGTGYTLLGGSPIGLLLSLTYAANSGAPVYTQQSKSTTTYSLVTKS